LLLAVFFGAALAADFAGSAAGALLALVFAAGFLLSGAAAPLAVAVVCVESELGVFFAMTPCFRFKLNIRGKMGASVSHPLTIAKAPTTPATDLLH
jgi:hypothetical protein